MIIWASGAETGTLEDFDYIQIWEDMSEAVYVNDTTYSWIFSTTKHSGSYCYRFRNWVNVLSQLGIQVYSNPTEMYMVIWLKNTTVQHAINKRTIPTIYFSNDNFSQYVCFGRYISTPENYGFWNSSGLLASSSNTFAFDVWQCIEIHIKIDASGILELKEDGVQTVSYYGDTSFLTAINKIWFQGGGYVGGSLYVDDIVIADTTGDYNNTWLGMNKEVLLLSTDADSVEKDEIISSTSNKYSAVNDKCVDYYDYDTYLYSQAPSSQQLFDCETLTKVTLKTKKVTINAIILDGYIKDSYKIDTKIFNFMIGYDNYYYYSENYHLPNSLDHIRHYINVNPLTDKPFTIQEVNKYEYGIKV
jgi:hypothetical protein